MAERPTAGDQLGRLLYLLPLASREGGVPLAEAAGALDVSVTTIQRDVADVTARAFYHPAGSADEIQISLEADRIKVFAGGKFTRPLKLSLPEALAVSLALRSAAADAEADRRTELLDLAHRIDLELAVTSAEDLASEIALDEDRSGGAGFRGLFEGAAANHLRCHVTYLKPDGEGPSDRDLDPYQVVYGRGRWYVIGYCHAREDVRVFRLDRILAARVTEHMFDPPDSFDPSAFVDGGRVFRSDHEHEVRVRYSPRIAPWIREKGPCEELEDGSVTVCFRVADPDWVMRHVLQYGPEAEILEPDDVRTMMCGVLGSIVGPAGPS